MQTNSSLSSREERAEGEVGFQKAQRNSEASTSEKLQIEQWQYRRQTIIVFP